MQEEMNQFRRNEVWDHMPRTNAQKVIETKWIFRKKMMKLVL